MTSSCDHVQRGKRLLRGAATLFTALLVATSTHAQSPQVPQPRPTPDETWIQHTITATTLCQWPMDAATPGHAAFWYVFDYLAEAHEQRTSDASSNAADESGLTALGGFEVLGTYFDEVRVLAFMGGGAAIAWSAAGNKEALLDVLREQGYEFSHVTAPFAGVDAGLKGRLPSETGSRALLVFDDKLQGPDGEIRPGGFTLLCRPNRP